MPGVSQRHSGLRTCSNQFTGEVPAWLASLTALLPANRFVSLAECGTTCTAGYWCTTASLSPVAHPCDPGTFSAAGATACGQCPVGRYTDVTGTPTQCTPCATGRYGATTGLTVATCTGQCPAGRYGSALGESSAQCAGPCDAGRWGGLGETTSQCTGVCAAGYVQLCPGVLG